MTRTAELVLDCRCALAEGPVWWEGKLWFVDIEGKALHRYDPATKSHDAYSVSDRIGFSVPTRKTGEWIAGIGDTLARWRPESGAAPDVFATPEPGNGTRFNDAKVDPNGRLFAGTTHLASKQSCGSLYRVDGDLSTHAVTPGVMCSNGLAWDASRGAMYYIDTPTKKVDRFDWNSATSAIANRRPVHAIEPGMGGPDGMCIDAAGNLWIALWGGRSVRCVDPMTGSVIEKIAVPAHAVTSCCFGGDDLKTLYITTARNGLSDEALKDQPHAGGIFAVRLGTPGLATVPFRFA